MANEKNLKPWPKGVSGNPKGGVPIRRNLEEVIQAFLQEKAEGTGQEAKTRLLAMMEAQWHKAVKNGDTRAADYLTKYGFGMPKQQIEHKGIAPVTIVDDIAMASGGGGEDEKPQ